MCWQVWVGSVPIVATKENIAFKDAIKIPQIQNVKKKLQDSYDS